MFGSLKIGKWLKELLFFAVVIFLVSWGIDRYRAPQLDGELPSISGATIQGAPVEQLVQRGKPFVLHFWGTWCPICRQEADNIERIANSYPLLSVAVKSGSDAELRAWMKERKLHYPVLNDAEGVLAARLGIGVYPTTFLFDGDGRLRFALTGYTTTLGLLARLKWIELSGDSAATLSKNSQGESSPHD